MIRASDPMTDENKYYELRRDCDQLATRMGVVEDKIDRLDQKFETTFEKLTDAVTSIDKKMDVFVARVESSTGAADKLVKIAFPLILALISGFWFWDNQIHQNIHQQQIETNNYPQIKK